MIKLDAKMFVYQERDRPTSTKRKSKFPSALDSITFDVLIWVHFFFKEKSLNFGRHCSKRIKCKYVPIKKQQFWNKIYIEWENKNDPKRFDHVGRGGGQVVSILAFHSDNPSSNSAKVYNLFVKM